MALCLCRRVVAATVQSRIFDASIAGSTRRITDRRGRITVLGENPRFLKAIKLWIAAIICDKSKSLFASINATDWIQPYAWGKPLQPAAQNGMVSG